MKQVKTESIFWSDEVKNEINNSTINLITVYDNSFVDLESKDLLNKASQNETVHCAWCGHRARYISLLRFDKVDGSETFHQIGQECLLKLKDINVNGLPQISWRIEERVKFLKKQAKIRSRKEKYAIDYAEEIKFLNSLPSLNGFMKDMLNILETGERELTANMVPHIERFIKKMKATKTVKSGKEISWEQKKENYKIIKAKLEALLRVIVSSDKLGFLDENCDLQNDMLVPEKHVFNFVKSVYESSKKYLGLTENQMKAINKVAKSYSKESVKEKEVEQKKVEEENVEIPF